MRDGHNRSVRRRRSIDNLPERLRSSLWFTPAIMVGCAVAGLALLLRLDSLVQDPVAILEFSGDPEAARDIASTIAGATMGFIGIVFSITIVALQLASSQFSPRALRGFLRDRVTKVTLGAFVSTLTYALLLIRSVDGADVVVPDLAMSGLFMLVIACIVLFIAYIDHVAHSIRVVNILETIAAETQRSILSNRPMLEREPLDDPAQAPLDARAAPLRYDGSGGVLVGVDRAALAELARASGVVIELHVRAGEYVRRGGVLGRANGATGAAPDVSSALSFDVERTMQDDVAFGLRQLVDVALRALSPGVNDPTTAVQALDRIHDALGQLAVRSDPDPWIRDADGAPRAWVRVTTWDELVALALDEVRVAGRGSLQVQRRLAAMLDDLLAVAPPARIEALQVRRDALRRSIDDAFADPLDRQLAASADPTGIG